MAENGNGPRPVPSLAAQPAVTDEDRNRYGLLLDRAAERGLIDPADYEVRLGELAEASTMEELNRIVTELPAFAARPARAARPAPGGSGFRMPGSGAGARTRSRRRSSPWILLVVVVALVAVSLVVLAVFAEHLARTHPSGLPSPTAARVLSAPRL